MDLNIEKRKEVLEYALQIEDSINLLLLLCLGINDKSKTKLFGNRIGISFQSKIDLLYDIDILTSTEHQGLELQMNFRNKFLHDIKFNTYVSILDYFESGIKSRFKKYLLDGGEISDESCCKKAYQNLFLNNLQTILRKIEMKQKEADENFDLLSTPKKLFLSFIDVYFNLIEDVEQQIANSDLEIKEVNNLANAITLKCKEHTSRFISNDEIKGIYHDYFAQITNKDKMEKLFS